MNSYIPDDWLRAVSAGNFLYPCAGHDYQPAISIFAPHVSDFTFCDLYYPAGLQMKPVVKPPEFDLISSDTEGALHSEISWVEGHREIDPSTLIEVYVRRQSNRSITIRRRRGFGQFALLAAGLQSISVFMHRGDSPGESGSNIYFLADCRSSYTPIGCLLTKLEERLTDRAIVLSDGSNTRLKKLRRLHRQNISGTEAFQRMGGTSFTHGAFRWRCIGFIDNRYGPTLAWGLERFRA
jgi:hypothetical protein